MHKYALSRGRSLFLLTKVATTPMLLLSNHNPLFSFSSPIMSAAASSSSRFFSSTTDQKQPSPQKGGVTQLTAISPIDGRYARQSNDLRGYYSEYALMKYRVFVEVEWFKRLFQEQIATKSEKDIQMIFEQQAFLDKIVAEFSIEDAEKVKSIEGTTNHDVKAIEYFLKEKFDKNAELAKYKEFIHFSCTSEDINNLAYALMIHHSSQKVMNVSLN